MAKLKDSATSPKAIMAWVESKANRRRGRMVITRKEARSLCRALGHAAEEEAALLSRIEILRTVCFVAVKDLLVELSDRDPEPGGGPHLNLCRLERIDEILGIIETAETLEKDATMALATSSLSVFEVLGEGERSTKRADGVAEISARRAKR